MGACLSCSSRPSTATLASVGLHFSISLLGWVVLVSSWNVGVLTRIRIWPHTESSDRRVQCHWNMTIRLNTLPLDIIHRLLVMLPDYRSLKNLISSTRVIYEAYTNHSKLISEAIARNLAGPAFIHAWNANRPGDEVLDPSGVFPLSALEQSNFDKECHASWALEDLYSLM